MGFPDEAISLLREFLRSSRTFQGIEFIGSYTMPREVFLDEFYSFLVTGYNTLDEYSDMVRLKWALKENEDMCWDAQTRQRYSDILDGLSGFGAVEEFMSSEQIMQARKILRRSEKEDELTS